MLRGRINREVIDMGLDDFAGNVCDQIESNESQFGELKYKDNKLQNANIKTVGGITGLSRNKEVYTDILIPDKIKKELIPRYVKSHCDRFYAEEKENEPASGVVSADEAKEAKQLEGLELLAILEKYADQFMGPMPAVERLNMEFLSS